MNTETQKTHIKNAYLLFRERREMPVTNWCDEDETALNLAANYDENVLRAAVAMAGAYNRSLIPSGDGKGGE